MNERRVYPSDLSGARWSMIAPRLTAWRQARTDARAAIGVKGRIRSHDLREIFDAILYVKRTGITTEVAQTREELCPGCDPVRRDRSRSLCI